MADKNQPKRIIFQVGGPYHPVDDQVSIIQEWLGTSYQIENYDGRLAFEKLETCDLFVAAGLHWTGCPQVGWNYEPMEEEDRDAFVKYIQSGKPVMGLHGGICCYDDWPEFGYLLGFQWDWRVTSHTAEGMWQVKVEKTEHPVIEGVDDYEIWDELYYNVQISPSMSFKVHAWAPYHGIRFPMIISAEGGRTSGAGKTLFLANGHNLESFNCPAFPRIMDNAIKWLLD